MLIALRHRTTLPALLLGALFLPSPALGDEDSWEGRRIMPANPGTRIGHTEPDGQQVYVAELTDLVYTVGKDQNGWLHLRHRGVADWLWKGQAVLLADAIDYFGQRIRTDRTDAHAFAHRGRAWQEEGEPERALRDLTEALRLQRKNTAWWRTRAAIYDDLREQDEALADLGEAIRLEPKDAVNYLQRGILYKTAKEYDKAIADHTAALRLDPKSSAAFFNRGNAFKAQKAYEKAIADYSEAIRLKPDLTAAYFNRANAHNGRKDHAQAIRDLNEVIRLDPQDADAHSNLAWTLATSPDAKIRDGKKAVEYATKACEWTSWKAPYFLAVLAVAHGEAGDFPQAIQWQKQALEFSRYERDEGDRARQRLKLFEERKPYREE